MNDDKGCKNQEGIFVVSRRKQSLDMGLKKDTGVSTALRIINENRIFLIIIFLGLIMKFIAPTFLTKYNILYIFQDIAVPGIIACGCLMLMIGGYFDLSVGANVALTGAIVAKLSTGGISIPVVLLVVLILGAVIGIVNAIVVIYFRVNSIVATLSMLSILRGILLLYSKEHIITGIPDPFLWFGMGSIGFLPVLDLFLILTAILCYVILQKSVFGRHIYAIGSNRMSAFLTGIKVDSVLTKVYMFEGILTSFAGFLFVTKYSAALPTAAMGLEITIIAAIIVGGARLFGGKGTIFNTIGGVVLMEMIFNAINLTNVNLNWRFIIQWLIIIFAVTYTVMLKESPDE
ncbi:MAG: ABC transporter permease [Thermoplasmata archaeon]|nr:MAG: ABC transporter permease [Thermoplasmata archaeon]